MAQVNGYWDVCVRWMTQTDEDTAPEGDPILSTTSALELACGDFPDDPSVLAYREQDTRVHHDRQRTCVGCGRPTQSTITGNPFCHSYVLYACSECRAVLAGEGDTC